MIYNYKITTAQAQALWKSHPPSSRRITLIFAYVPANSTTVSEMVDAREPARWPKGTEFYTTAELVNNIPKE